MAKTVGELREFHCVACGRTFTSTKEIPSSCKRCGSLLWRWTVDQGMHRAPERVLCELIHDIVVDYVKHKIIISMKSIHYKISDKFDWWVELTPVVRNRVIAKEIKRCQPNAIREKGANGDGKPTFYVKKNV